MGILYSGKVETMMPKLHSQNFEGMELIRPLYLVKEEAIKSWRDSNGLHFIQCACRFTENCTMCDNGGGGSKRQEIKTLIRRLKRDNSYIEKSIFNGIHSVSIDTFAGYKSRGIKHSFLESYDEKTPIGPMKESVGMNRAEMQRFLSEEVQSGTDELEAYRKLMQKIGVTVPKK